MLKIVQKVDTNNVKGKNELLAIAHYFSLLSLKVRAQLFDLKFKGILLSDGSAYLFI